MKNTNLPADASMATAAIHADDNALAPIDKYRDIAPPIGVSTIFKYPEDMDAFIADTLAAETDPTKTGTEPLVYARFSTVNTRRAEEILSQLIGAPVLTYSNGLSAFHSSMIALNPKRIFLGPCYHGVKAICHVLARNYDIKILPLDSDPELVQPGDVIHVETPINPYGTCENVPHYAAIAEKRGAVLTIDATFAPPPLFDPFKFGAKLVIHSGTKFFGGHSDLLAGVVATKDAELRAKLYADREILGTITPSLDSWLLLRSLRTFELRINRQLENAKKIVAALHDNLDKLSSLQKVYHSSLQTEPFVKELLPRGGPSVFSIATVDEKSARELPGKLRLFHHATSLGGVESLIEWRRLTDRVIPPNILRISVGVENADDLINDLLTALA